ncbi:MAG: FIST C-terminal domain-containing protein, partial [Deltaproteobacteria bacterium]|nr:FIST C-terminal domain-containing protein [Deltaproteobacteria bacterium]
MLNAWTLEADDPAVAVAEILEQLDLENRLLAHSVGFITCSYDYVETGMVHAICNALPFEVAGCTTLTNAVDQEAGTLLLCLSVLTADDCRFATALTPALGDNAHAIINETFRRCAAQLEGQPRLVLAFLPMLGAVSGELMLHALNDAAAGTPIFGTIACDSDTAHYSNTFTIHNGACSRDGMSVLLISGNVHPRFVVTSTSEQNLHKQQAIITSSEGSVLKGINGMSAQQYLASLGLLRSEGMAGMSSVPFVVDYNDGSQPVARALYSLNDDGSASCGGVMPEGGTLSIGRMDVDDILLTAEQSLRKLLQNEGLNGIIMFPCLGRNMVLAVDPLGEIEKVRSVVGNALPWHLAYSGGELCPVYGNDGCTVNRFH